jgi:hypothetical protein
VTVVKTMALPQLVHVLSVIPSPGAAFIKKLEGMFSEFIWNSKTGKVSRKLLAQDYMDGGLKLTHVDSFVKALKIKWIKKVLMGKEDWISVLKYIVGDVMYEFIWQMDKKSLKMLARKIDNDLWRDRKSVV